MPAEELKKPLPTKVPARVPEHNKPAVGAKKPPSRPAGLGLVGASAGIGQIHHQQPGAAVGRPAVVASAIRPTAKKMPTTKPAKIEPKKRY